MQRRPRLSTAAHNARGCAALRVRLRMHARIRAYALQLKTPWLWAFQRVGYQGATGAKISLGTEPNSARVWSKLVAKPNQSWSKLVTKPTRARRKLAAKTAHAELAPIASRT